MRVIFVFLSVIVAACYAGVGVLTPREEQEAMRLWMQYCSGQEGGQDGSLYVYCKIARENYEESLNHEITVTPAPTAPRQVIFVQPPAYTYRHNIAINGPAGPAQKTTIYVLPQKATNNVDFKDNREQNGKPNKPTLFFLKNNPNESQTNVDSEPAPAPPSGGYLPPQQPQQQQQGYNYRAPSNPLRFA